MPTSSPRAAIGGRVEVREEDRVTFDDDLTCAVVEPAVMAPTEQHRVLRCEFAVVGEGLLTVGNITPGGRGVTTGPSAALVADL